MCLQVHLDACGVSSNTALALNSSFYKTHVMLMRKQMKGSLNTHTWCTPCWGATSPSFTGDRCLVTGGLRNTWRSWGKENHFWITRHHADCFRRLVWSILIDNNQSASKVGYSMNHRPRLYLHTDARSSSRVEFNAESSPTRYHLGHLTRS